MSYRRDRRRHAARQTMATEGIVLVRGEEPKRLPPPTPEQQAELEEVWRRVRAEHQTRRTFARCPHCRRVVPTEPLMAGTIGRPTVIAFARHMPPRPGPVGPCEGTGRMVLPSDEVPADTPMGAQL